MAFLRSIRPDEDLEVIRGQTLTLRQPAVVDYAEWAELRALSRAHLTPGGSRRGPMTIWRVRCIADASGLTQRIYATTRPTLILSSMPRQTH